MLDDLRRALRMDSPAPRLSESNIRKLSRGLRSSKKSRLSIQSTLETQSVQDGSLVNRSVSLSTLLPSGNGQGQVQRVDKLQSLEAKMASIEVSLGWRRRREALLETLPRAARELVRELDALHQTVREKENCIQGLRTQITNLGGTVSGVGDGVGGFVVTESEKKTIQERLEKVESEIESKKVTVKNLKISLDKIDITDNIDVRIRAAELEYELEREELNILNLKEEASVLSTRLQESCLAPPVVPVDGVVTCQVKSKVPLYEYLLIPGHISIVSGVSLVSANVSSTPGNPPFHVTCRPPFGCVIDWATDDTRLKKGDRLIEINGEIVFGKSIEDVTKIMSSCQNLALVVARPFGENLSAVKRLEKQVEEKQKENKELTNRLEKALKEKESLKNDNTRLSHRISYLEDQVNELQSTLQKAKDAALINGSPNEVLTPTQPGATIIQVFQKGHQTLAVAAPTLEKTENRVQEYPTLPRIKSPSSSSSRDQEDENNDTESTKTNDSTKTNSTVHYETVNGHQHRNHEPNSSMSRNGYYHHEQIYAKKTGSNKRKETKERFSDDYSDYQSINIMFKQNSDLKSKYSSTNDDYDCIEKLRDKLTEKSPSYSYSSSNNEKSHTKTFSNHKRSPQYEYIYSEPVEPLYGKLTRSRERGQRSDSRSNEKEDDFLISKECDRRKQRHSNIYEKASRRVVSPGSDDFRLQSRPRPIPPKKPERLSLHRTTSMQSMEDATRCSSKASMASNMSRTSKPDKKQHQSSENIYSIPDNIYETSTTKSSTEKDAFKTSRTNGFSEEVPIVPSPRSISLSSTRIHPQNSSKEERRQSYKDQTKIYESPYVKQSPYIPNGSHSYSRSKSPDSSFHLDVSLGLDLHEDVRAQPIHDYLYQTTESLSNIQKSQQLLKQSSSPKKGTEKGSYGVPSTPTTPPRGKSLSLKNRGKEGEEWC